MVAALRRRRDRTAVFSATIEIRHAYGNTEEHHDARVDNVPEYGHHKRRLRKAAPGGGTVTRRGHRPPGQVRLRRSLTADATNGC
jgi:hypothetical protein